MAARDLLDEMVDERSARNPEVPKLLAVARLRVASVLAVSVLGGALVAGCGAEEGADEDPAKVLEETFNPDKAIDSGVLDLSLGLSIVSRDGEDSETIGLGGPFQSVREGELPQFNLALNIAGQTGGVENLNFEGGAIGTADAGYIEFQGQSYEINPEVFGRLQSAALFSGQDLSRWISDPVNEAREEVEGVETIHVTGSANVKRVFADLQTLAEQAGLESADLKTSRGFFPTATVDLFTGADDSILRRLELHFEWQGQLEGGEDFDGTIDFSLTFSKVNEDQKIEAPKNPQPLSEFADQVPIELGGLAEFLAGGPASGG